MAAGASGTFIVIYTVNAGTASGTIITDTATVNATNQSFGANSATATDVVATATQADLALSTAATPVDSACREQYYLYADGYEQWPGGSFGCELHRGNPDEYDVPIRLGSGGLDLHDSRGRRHGNCYLH